MLATVCFLKGNFASRWTIVSVPKMVKLLSWPSPIYWEINLTESLKNVGLNNPPTRCELPTNVQLSLHLYFVFQKADKTPPCQHTRNKTERRSHCNITEETSWMCDWKVDYYKYQTKSTLNDLWKSDKCNQKTIAIKENMPRTL